MTGVWVEVGYAVGIALSAGAGGMSVRFALAERARVAARAARAAVRRAEAEWEVAQAPRPPEVVRARRDAVGAPRRAGVVPVARRPVTATARMSPVPPVPVPGRLAVAPLPVRTPGAALHGGGRPPRHVPRLGRVATG